MNERISTLTEDHPHDSQILQAHHPLEFPGHKLEASHHCQLGPVLQDIVPRARHCPSIIPSPQTTNHHHSSYHLIMNPVSFTTKYVDKWKKHNTLHPGVKENSTYKPSFLKGNQPSLQGFTQDTSIAKDCLQKLKTRIAKNQRQALQGFTQESIAKNCLRKLHK